MQTKEKNRLLTEFGNFFQDLVEDIGLIKEELNRLNRKLEKGYD